MTQDYDRRQHGDEWPRRGRWNPAGLPDWYCGMLVELAGKLTRWCDDDRDPHRLDPRCDPRCPQDVVERRAAR